MPNKFAARENDTNEDQIVERLRHDIKLKLEVSIPFLDLVETEIESHQVAI